MKKYISELGYDYTEYIKSEEDIEKFIRICEYEEKCKGVPLKDCIESVIACTNLDAELRKINRKVILQKDPLSN